MVESCSRVAAIKSVLQYSQGGGGDGRTKSPDCVETWPALQSVLERRERRARHWADCSHIAPLEAGTVEAIIHITKLPWEATVFFLAPTSATEEYPSDDRLQHCYSHLFSSLDSNDEEVD